jgi:hypothetical protein
MLVVAANRSFDSLLNEEGHDCYYSVDTNMIIFYVNGKLPGWVDYVDHLSAKGKRFFVTNAIYEEYNKGLGRQITEYSLPSPFHRLDDEDASYKASIAYPALMKEFNISPDNTHFAIDARWILESGYCIAASLDIPEAAVVERGKVFAITCNAKLIQRLFNSLTKRRTFENIVNQHGLEHLVNMRSVSVKDGTFLDKYSYE